MNIRDAATVLASHIEALAATNAALEARLAEALKPLDDWMNTPGNQRDRAWWDGWYSDIDRARHPSATGKKE